MAKLLLIEDDARDLELLETKLRGAFQFDSARSLRDAQKKAANNDYDVVLMDIGLPDITRDAAVKAAKALAGSAAVVVLSGCDDPKFIHQTIMDNASNYLVKGRDDKTTECLVSKINSAISTHSICRTLDVRIKTLTDERDHKLVPIMLVDDSEDDRLLMRVHAEGRGIELLEAKTSEEAMQLIAERPDIELSVVDLRLCSNGLGLDGVWLVQQLESEGRRVVILSGRIESYVHQLKDSVRAPILLKGLSLSRIWDSILPLMLKPA